MSYVLQGGDEGADRLRLLARAKWPTTRDVLQKVGLAEGMHCLDVGCGIGEVTLQLSRWVGPTGRVVGIDLNEAFIATARVEAARQGRAAIFEVADGSSPGYVGTFDLVYARFLLTHLPRPEEALRNLIRAARPGGTVLVEDIDFDGHFCYPDSPAFRRYLELYAEVVRSNGGDACIGPRLPNLFLDAGLEDVQLEVVLPTYRTGEGKRITPVTMAHIRNAVVRAGLATAAEVDQVVAELEAFAASPRTLLSMSRVFQVWGRVAANGAGPLPRV